MSAPSFKQKPPTPYLMTAWLVLATHANQDYQAWEDRGLYLLDQGGDIDRGLVPKGSAALFDTLKIKGRMEWVDRVRTKHAAEKDARTLNQNSSNTSEGVFCSSRL